MITRRNLARCAPSALALAALGNPARAAGSEAEPVRLGVLKFGTVQWVTDVIQRHALDAAHGVALRTVILANNDAGRVALLGGSADVVVSDWLFVASQRAAGNRLSFAPFTDATGGVMVGRDSPIRSLADLKGRRLGVAGGPIDKSWIIMQAAARATGGVDLASAARVDYGAPPLLDAKLGQGELDAVLTYWNFAARLEAEGAREAITVADCARALGLPAQLGLVGFVFHEDWARQHRAAIDGFLAAAAEAEQLLARSDAEWDAVRPLMQAPNDVLFAALKRRFIAGIPHETAEQEEATAARVLDILRHTGGARATANLSSLPEGMFWRVPADHG